ANNTEEKECVTTFTRHAEDEKMTALILFVAWLKLIGLPVTMQGENDTEEKECVITFARHVEDGKMTVLIL
ncbi:hypothetical protein RYX36_010332, partial [Vicia faba]